MARTDFAGAVPYGRLLRPGQEPGDAVRDEGREVLRWTWGDLGTPDRIGGRVRRAQERGALRVR